MHEFGFKIIEWIVECGDVKGIYHGRVECKYEQINGGVWSGVKIRGLCVWKWREEDV